MIMEEVEIAKRRNLVSGIAYILVAVLGFIFTIGDFLQTGFEQSGVILNVVFEILIGLCGVYLLLLKKRDLTGLTLIMFSMLFSFYTFTGGVRFSAITFALLWFFILFPIFIMTTKEPKATTYFCVLFPYGIGAIGYAISSGPSIMAVVMHFIFSALALITGIQYIVEKIQTKNALKLRADEEMEFTKTGPCLGAYVLSVVCLVSAAAINSGLWTSDLFNNLSFACGICMIIFSAIIYYFCRLKWRTVMGVLTGASILCYSVGLSFDSVEGLNFFVISGILFLLVTAFSVILDHKVLPAISTLLIGICLLMFGLGFSHPTLSTVLLTIAGIVGLYISLLFLNRRIKLPMF